MRLGRTLACALALLLVMAVARAEDYRLAERQFNYAGHKAFYVEAGTGEPLIFLHNGGTSHRIWEAQLRHFSRTHHVYAMDNLGFGRSDKPDIDYPLELHIKQLETFIDHLGADKVTLVAHCMGGAMALNFTARHPEKVRKLILLNVYTEQTLLSGTLAEQYRTHSSNPEALAAAVAAAKRSTGNAHSSDPMSSVALTRVVARADTYGISDRLTLPSNMPPFYILWGEENPTLRYEAGKALCQRLQPQACVGLPGRKHMAMLEDPEGFTQAVEKLLAHQAVR